MSGARPGSLLMNWSIPIPPLVRRAALVAAVVSVAGCGAIKTMALKSVAKSLSETGDTITSHDDPDLVEDAMPFTLTFYESFVAELPRFEPILTATCGLYTQYAFGFVAPKGEAMQWENFDESKVISERALRLAIRGRGYCWRGLEEKFRGVTAALKDNPDTALRRAKREHVPLLYWSAASLGAAISAGGLSHPELLNNWPTVRALAERALVLDESWNTGALHELMITVESQGELFGGSEERARKHFARAVEIQQGLSPGPHVALAMGVVRAKQDKAEFEKLMKEALAMDPDKNPTQRLVVLITQRRAKVLLAHIDDLFLLPRPSSR
jgi:hypothetical protein